MSTFSATVTGTMDLSATRIAPGEGFNLFIGPHTITLTEQQADDLGRFLVFDEPLPKSRTPGRPPEPEPEPEIEPAPVPDPTPEGEPS